MSKTFDYVDSDSFQVEDPREARWTRLALKHNKIDRIKMVKAMEYICRQINDEDVLDRWLALGVADGDISDGELSVYYEDDSEELACYIDDVPFADLMDEFLHCMACALTSGGLYCAGVVSLGAQHQKNKEEIK